MFLRGVCLHSLHAHVWFACDPWVGVAGKFCEVALVFFRARTRPVAHARCGLHFEIVLVSLGWRDGVCSCVRVCARGRGLAQTRCVFTARFGLAVLGAMVRATPSHGLWCACGEKQLSDLRTPELREKWSAHVKQ